MRMPIEVEICNTRLDYNSFMCVSNFVYSVYDMKILHKTSEKLFYEGNKQKIKLVCQESASGCAVGCAAMVLRTTYATALNLLHPNIRRYSWYSRGHETSLEDIKNAFKKKNIPCYISTDKKILFDKSIRCIFIFDWDGNEDASHCVVYDRGRYYDPGGRGYQHSKDEYEFQFKHFGGAALVLT